MRQKIRAIIGHHLDGNDKDYEKIIDKILRLFNVSGNEAQPKENKKESEAAVCPHCKGKLYIGIRINWCEKCEKIVKQT